MKKTYTRWAMAYKNLYTRAIAREAQKTMTSYRDSSRVEEI